MIIIIQCLKRVLVYPSILGVIQDCIPCYYIYTNRVLIHFGIKERVKSFRFSSIFCSSRYFDCRGIRFLRDMEFLVSRSQFPSSFIGLKTSRVEHHGRNLGR